MPGIPVILQKCVKVEPNQDVLAHGQDELMAELLALHRSVRGAVQAGKKKFSQRHLYQVVRGEASGGEQRAELFKGRVHFKMIEIADQIAARRDLLIGDALDVYGEALRRQGKGNKFKNKPDLALKAAHDVVHGLGVFSRETKVRLQDDNGESPGQRMDKERLVERIERSLLRRKKKAKKKKK